MGVENCWLVTEQDDEEVESSLLAEDVWIAATSEHGDVTLTDTDCWLPKVEVKDETISSVEDSVDPSPNGSLMRGWKDIPEEEVTVPEEEAKEDDEASIVTLDPTESTTTSLTCSWSSASGSPVFEYCRGRTRCFLCACGCSAHARYSYYMEHRLGGIT